MNKTAKIIYWIARLVAALILLQTLYFKFSGSYESIYIFSKVGMEPWGRIGVGILELIASVLILVSATAWIGAGLALGLMIGAIAMHLTILGIQVQGEDGTFDGGQLFIYAVIVTLCSVFILWQNKEKILSIIRRRSS